MKTPIRGSEMARQAGYPDHADAIEAMLQQLLIALVKRAGGRITVPVDEIDATGNDLLAMQLLPDGRTYNFEVRKKS